MVATNILEFQIQDRATLYFSFINFSGAVDRKAELHFRQKNTMNPKNIQQLIDLEAQFDLNEQELISNLPESKTITGADREDILIGSANNKAIVGLAEDDLLLGKSDRDTLVGGVGDDILISSRGNALLYGNEGDDSLSIESLITSTNENSTIVGGQGKDELSGSKRADLLFGGADADELEGDSGNDGLHGGAGNDEVEGEGGDDLVYGDVGNDDVEGGDGNDTVDGGAGNDEVEGGDGNDLVYGGDGGDTITGDDGNDTADGDAGDDLVAGGDGNDLVYGGNGDDTITGRDGNDTVDGGTGDDLVTGEDGNDLLTGGKGNDNFVLLANTGTDVISDFEDGADRLVLIEDSPEGTLTFDRLKIAETNNNTVISVAETGKTLAELAGVSAATINAEDFVTKSIEDFGVSDEEVEDEETEMPSDGNLSTADDPASEIAESDLAANQSQNDASVDDQQQPSNDPNLQTGSVVSQGVETMKVDEVRQDFGLDGEGVKIGIIGDSFDRSRLTEISAEDDVLSGDLPGEGNPNGYKTPVRILDDSIDNSNGNGASDEGRAMAQLIHDVAPGAELLFHSGVDRIDDEQQLAEAIDDLTAAGADIIVDDLGFPVEPFFQDGISAQAVDRSVNSGVSYFSATGNGGNDSYEAHFRPENITSEVDLNFPIEGAEERYVFHDFDPDNGIDVFQDIALEAEQEIELVLQWDEPFASAGGKGTSNDLDMFLLDSESNIVRFSTEANVGKEAVERLSFANPGEETAEYRLVIAHDTAAGGEAPGLIKYLNRGKTIQNAEYFTNSSAIAGHENAVGATAVGAVNYTNTPEFGVDPAVINDFSAVGNTPILFDEEGNRLPESEIRQKPEIVAPDGTNTTFFGDDDDDTDDDGFPNFPGTSAAAPHAAGVAALLLEANPDATPEQINDALIDSALDMDNPYTQGADPGYDPATGYGLIQADAALETLMGTSDTGLADLAPGDL